MLDRPEREEDGEHQAGDRGVALILGVPEELGDDRARGEEVETRMHPDREEIVRAGTGPRNAELAPRVAVPEHPRAAAVEQHARQAPQDDETDRGGEPAHEEEGQAVEEGLEEAEPETGARAEDRLIGDDTDLVAVAAHARGLESLLDDRGEH